ncbi:PaaI family thioesterase [Methylobacterium mesophilicum SR1.6/6]|uniref:PaaI family thioesterase n=1 Tax=Methylobacterium mesophilicum SR1.6/6 TaxID=908290 RepID=A0A6B9FIR9_9HYPH|nr:PaaI family thioesterase [Methylobacterium mesophilicum]QGY01656.1 PaaI family thioesterase [Methylobacterium mesophilicum SR1.6/6]
MPTETARDPAPSRRRLVEWSDPALVAKAGQGLDGLAFLRAMLAGEVPHPPLIALLGIDLVSADPGRVTMRMGPGEYLYNPLGSVHGGALASLLDSVMGCAVHSTLPLGRGYTTLEIKVNYLRAVTAASGPLLAVGEIVHAGRRQAVAEARLTDVTGRLCATASTTCLLLDAPSRGDTPPPAMDPVLAERTRNS